MEYAVQDSCLLVISKKALSQNAKDAFEKISSALDFDTPPTFLPLDELEDLSRLQGFIFEIDPWSVIACDAESILALRQTLHPEAQSFNIDQPAEVCGYTLVAVPNFEQCLDDKEQKQIAWARLQAAKRPQTFE